tara:strand:+ start:136 stop:711 length:576 start_codon:yes stop_codon:yes gene_type:complete
MICLGEIDDNLRANTKCGHTFHTECLLLNLVKGSEGHKCPLCRTEIISDNNSEIKQENVILEGTVQLLEEELRLHQDWVLYFHDLSDRIKTEKIRQQAELKYLKKNNKMLMKNFKNVQDKLSKSLIQLDIKSHKCSVCNCLGHNSKTCVININKNKFINQAKTSKNLREKEEIFNDLRYGKLKDLVDNHFE